MTCSVLRARIIRGFVVLFLILELTIGSSRLVCAQSAAAPSSAGTKASSGSDVRFRVETSSRFGVRNYVAGHWADLHLQLENAGTTPRELLCTSYFDEQPNLQFGRQVWLPARARLNISHPALIPELDSDRNRNALLRSLVIERASGDEALVESDTGQLRHAHSLVIAPALRNTGIIAGWNTMESLPEDVQELVGASRENQGLVRNFAVLTGHFLPSAETSLTHLDHLVLAESRLAEDLAALSAVRRWLYAGGRLWVMLDRTDPVVLDRLLGDEFRVHVVDRVSLTSVRIDTAPSPSLPNGELGETVEYEEPVEMLRVVASGVDVWNTVDGWPAAMTKAYGEGRILITTLGARGWLQPSRPATGPEHAAPQAAAGTLVPVPAMSELAAYVLAAREPEPFTQAALESLAQEHIAYRVPQWSLVVGTLCCFLALMCALGLWLWRTERLEHFGWSGSLLAVLFGVVLTGIGMANRYGVPETRASVQIVQSLGGTDDLRARGLLAVFRHEEDPQPIRTTHGGTLWPEVSAGEAAMQRLVTTDLGVSHWEGKPQPAGLHTYPYVTGGSSERTTARATLNSDGVIGTYEGPPAAQTDAVLATRFGRIGVTLDGNGGFTAAADDVLETDQYLQAAFVGDVQDRRRRILQQLFESRSWHDSLERPHLLVWLNDWDQGIDFGEGLQQQGETLLSVPLEIVRPAVGAELLIPPPLISYSTSPPPDGSLQTGFWDDLRKEWQERSEPSTTWLRFQVPRELLPVEAVRARVTIKASGAMGRLELLGLRNDEVVSLEAVENPAGSLTIDIDDPDVLAVADDGTLSLGVSAGVPNEAADPGGTAFNTEIRANYWRINSLALQLWGRAADSSHVD